nr:MAG TPA: hypothetical protein [Caudoviricetes sp.]
MSNSSSSSLIFSSYSPSQLASCLLISAYLAPKSFQKSSSRLASS